jgi:hypothetical protein
MAEIQVPIQVEESVKEVPEHVENVSAAETTKNEAAPESNEPVIPKTCKAGVVVNSGPNFTMAVEDVPVPEPGTLLFPSSPPILLLANTTNK